MQSIAEHSGGLLDPSSGKSGHLHNSNHHKPIQLKSARGVASTIPTLLLSPEELTCQFSNHPGGRLQLKHRDAPAATGFQGNCRFQFGRPTTARNIRQANQRPFDEPEPLLRCGVTQFRATFQCDLLYLSVPRHLFVARGFLCCFRLYRTSFMC